MENKGQAVAAAVNTAVTSIFNQIRKNVSRDRTRFEDEKYNLDLTYITSRIIAMAFPASGLEAAWRNHIDDVSNMFNEYHRGHYRIWNLSERKYNYSKFDNQMMEYGFPDHHSPPLTLLCNIINSMHDWLISDRLNVAAIHCVGGKGRTGTVICAFLVFVSRFQTADEAFEYFAAKRSAKEKGVTQPCQKRYVRYFQEVLSMGRPPRPKTLLLTKIVMKGIPGIAKGNTGCNPAVRIFLQSKYPKTCIYSTSPKGVPAKFVSKTDESVTWTMNCPVKGDILLKCAHAGKHRTRHMFRYAFHTAFIQDVVHRDYVLVLRPSDLDDFRVDTIRREKADKRGLKTEEGNYENFFLMLVFSPMNDSVRIKDDNVPLDDTTLATYERLFTKRGALKGRPVEMEDDFHPGSDSPLSHSRDGSTSSSSFNSPHSSGETRPLAISEPVLVSATNTAQLPGVAHLVQQQTIVQQQPQFQQLQQLHQQALQARLSQDARSVSPTTAALPAPTSSPTHLAPPHNNYMRRQASSPTLSDRASTSGRSTSPYKPLPTVPSVPPGYSTLRRAPASTSGSSRSPTSSDQSPPPISPVTGRAISNATNRPAATSSPVAPAQMVREGLAAPVPSRLKRQSMTIAKISETGSDSASGTDETDLPSYLRASARTIVQPDPRRLTNHTGVDSAQRAPTVHIDRTARARLQPGSPTPGSRASTHSGSPEKTG